jgi:hypothetical protein
MHGIPLELIVDAIDILIVTFLLYRVARRAASVDPLKSLRSE